MRTGPDPRVRGSAGARMRAPGHQSAAASSLALVTGALHMKCSQT